MSAHIISPIIYDFVGSGVLASDAFPVIQLVGVVCRSLCFPTLRSWGNVGPFCSPAPPTVHHPR